MEPIVKYLVRKHTSLFHENPTIKRINVGFTNTIYSVNDKYILKICTRDSNEENFKREIEFYKENAHNPAIPKLIYSSIYKKDVPYCYEILEQVKGVTLYNVWHELTEKQRAKVIKELCITMELIHSKKCKPYDWCTHLKEEFSKVFTKFNSSTVFNEQEIQLLLHAYSKFDKYLPSKSFAKIHNDIHFDNVIYNNGEIKLIDFERTTSSPIDYELATIYRMINKPWKYASEETEEYTNSQDYSNIEQYIKRYYPEIVSVNYLTQRIAIYNMIYYLNQLSKHPNIQELKDEVISSARIVALKDEITFDLLRTPNDLMLYMNMNIRYGWLDKRKHKHVNNLRTFRENYRSSSIEEILKTNLGTCIEQVKLTKHFLDKLGIENRVYTYRAYETDYLSNNDVIMHCFILYNVNNTWYHFEHSNQAKRGIHEYHSIEEAISKITDGYEQKELRILTKIPDLPEGLSYKEFNEYINKFDEIPIIPIKKRL